jgi:hypothetical protein
MPTVYRARDATDASLIRDVLGQSGINAHVRGGELQSGVGELPAGGLVAVWVDDGDVTAAREVIARWERGEFALDDGDDSEPAIAAAPAPRRKASALLAFVTGCVVGALAVWATTHGPMQETALDHDGDGRIDDRAFFSPQGLERMEYDRNHDGRVDEIVRFESGVAQRAESDNDFDGRFETRAGYRHGVFLDWESDYDGDGAVEYRMEANAGVIAREQWLDAESRVLKQVLYQGGLPRTQEFDSDGDGVFERRQRLDALAEPVPAR